MVDNSGPIVDLRFYVGLLGLFSAAFFEEKDTNVLKTHTTAIRDHGIFLGVPRREVKRFSENFRTFIDTRCGKSRLSANSCTGCLMAELYI